MRLILLLLLLIQGAYGRTDKVLFIRVEFSDRLYNGTPEEWLSHLQTIQAQNQSYWIRNSYGVLEALDTTYTEVLQLGSRMRYDDILQNSGTSAATFALGDDAEAAALAAGYQTDMFDHIIYSYPALGIIAGGAVATRGMIWLPTERPLFTALIHEFGHSLGVGHASSIEGNPDTVIYPGQHREGRDGLYMMGSEAGISTVERGSINVPMRHSMGFVRSEAINQATEDGIYRIWDQDIVSLPASPITLATRFRVNFDEFWLSFAPDMSIRWADFDSEGFETGVIAHLVPSGGTITRILDFTPGSFQTTDDNERDWKDTRDGALTIGHSYNFPNSSVTITPRKVGVDDRGIRYIDVEISGITENQFCYEPFDYIQGSSIDGAAGGIGWSDAWDIGFRVEGEAVINNYGLNYSNLPVGGNSLRVFSDVTGINVSEGGILAETFLQRNTSRTYGRLDETSWNSFLFRPLSNEVERFSFFHRGVNVIRRNAGNLALGNTTGTIPIDLNQTYFIVVKSVRTATARSVFLWVNPNLTNGEPDETTADLTSTDFIFESSNLSLSLSENASAGYDLDEIRVGLSWPSVTQWLIDESLQSDLDATDYRLERTNSTAIYNHLFQVEPNFIYSITNSQDLNPLSWVRVPELNHFEPSGSALMNVPISTENLERNFYRLQRQRLFLPSEAQSSVVQQSNSNTSVVSRRVESKLHECASCNLSAYQKSREKQ